MSEIETSEIIWRNYNEFKTGESNYQNEIKTPFDTRNQDGAENQNKWSNLEILNQNMKEPHSQTETKTSLDPRHHENGAENWSEIWIGCACVTPTITQIHKSLHSLITDKQKVVIEKRCYSNYLIGKKIRL